MVKTFMSVDICQCLTMTNRVALATKLCERQMINFASPHSKLTLSLLAPGLDRSWSECCWFQLEPVGPDMLRPTPGYAPI